MIFVKAELPKQQVVDSLKKNLSIIDWKEIRKNCNPLTCIDLVKHIPNAIGPFTNTGYYYIPSVQIVSMDRIFVFKDAAGKLLTPLWHGRVQDEYGIARDIDPLHDQIIYALRIGFQGARKDVTLYASGFEQVGRDLFEDRCAKELHQEMEQHNYDICDMVQEVSSRTWNIFITTYVTKKETLGFTVRKVTPDENKLNFKTQINQR